MHFRKQCRLEPHLCSSSQTYGSSIAELPEHMQLACATPVISAGCVVSAPLIHRTAPIGLLHVHKEMRTSNLEINQVKVILTEN